MVYNIVHIHNGFINVSSEIGRGSIFSLYIPVDESMIIKESTLQPEFKKGRGKILIIDDEESICQISSEILEYCGYEVTAECDPELAVKRYSENQDSFACIILDLNMPKKNGFEVLQQIKTEYPDVKVIYYQKYK
jgi:PleD family two-component response regulator